MSVSGKTVYRVRQVVANDFAIIVEVKGGEASDGKIRETRDHRIVLGGTDSFWLVGGEKKEQKLIIQKDEASLPEFASGISPMTARIRTGSIFDLPKIFDNAVRGNFDVLSFSAATRLSTGYSPPDGDARELLAALARRELQIPLETSVSAIEVRPGQWLTSGFDVLSPGRYGFTRPSLRAVAVSTLENRPETIKLPQGLVVFLTQPKWSEPRETDLRSEEQIFQSVGQWLSRSKAALSLPDGAGDLAPAELLRLLTDRAVSEDEKADLEAIAGHLSKRSELFDILPGILSRDPVYLQRLADFEDSEKARLRAELDGQLRKEAETERTRLAAVRSEIADAEAKLAIFSHRETLLNNETAKHEETLRARIESAAKGIWSDFHREAALIRDEVARLREEMAQIATAGPVAPVTGEVGQTEKPVLDAPPLPLASDEQRQNTLRELAVATGLSLSQAAAAVAMATDVIPVLIGVDASAAAVDIATALAGNDAAIVFCDPTKVSLTDLLNDEQSGLRVTIDRAKERPATLAAVALCNITSCPCEYWLPQIVELRRVGRLPRNLAIIGSTGVDGIRVSIPDSALRHLLPMVPSKKSRPGTVKFEGLWPISAAPDAERLQEALDILVERGLEGAVLQNAAKTLARTPSWLKLPDLADIFLRQAEWLAASAAGEEHEYKKYFQEIEI
jgi:hypothetical protein